MTTKPRKRSQARPKPPPPGTSESYLSVLLEDMRAQNRATIEAVQSAVQWFKKEMDTRLNEHDEQIQSLVLAVQQNSADIRKNSEDIQVLQEEVRGLKLETRRLSGVVDCLSGRMISLEDRVEKVETVVRVPAYVEGSARPTPT